MADKKPGNDLLSYVIDGMIQGVSQQSPWDRRDTQCEAQFDCVNSPVNGCEARPGFDLIKKIDSLDHTGAFCYEIFRGDTEHYQVVIDVATSGSPARKLHVYDMNTGLECTVTYVASKQVTISIATAALINWPGNGFALNQPITLDTTGDLPAPFVADTTYYVTTTGDNLQVAAAVGGTPINTTGSVQDGVHTLSARVSTPTGMEAYFATVGSPKDRLMASTLQDFTFIGNREVTTRMSTTKLSPPKKNAGLIYVKAGGYLITYQAAVTYDGKVYTWQYVTPDNSTTGNAAYIATNQIAAAFFRSFTGVDAVVTASGDTVPGLPASAVPGVGAAGSGNVTASGSSFTGALTLTALGFTVRLNGGNILISREEDFPLPVTMTIASPAVVHWVSHSMAVDRSFKFATTGALPTGVKAGVKYYVTTVVDADHFQFSASIGGSAINTSGSQSGSHTVTVETQWDLDTADGAGNTYFLCAKDTTQSFGNLPQSCFSGFTVKVIGSNQQVEDDYFVQFQGADGSSGYWEEVIAPGTSLTFDETTMPLALVNTGAGTFDLKVPPWGNRVAGDGIFSALDPSFIGFPLQEMSFDNGRLALMGEGSCVWSHTTNNFVFFPDSAQSIADSDPIDAKPAGGTTIALLRRIVHIAETTFLWAEKIQFRATSGVNPFTQQTVELPPSTNYEFTAQAIPRAVGQSLYFATELGSFTTLRDLAVQNNLPVGATDVTGHVKKYIPAGLRWITASDTLGVLFCISDNAPSNIFLYNYLLSATARLQSAWNTWRLPPGCTVLWAGMDLNFLYALVQRADGICLLRADLSVDLVDADTGSTYHTRLDMRVTEAQCTVAYNATTGLSTVTMPYGMSEAAAWNIATSTDPCPVMIGNRDSTGPHSRGYSWAIQSFPSINTILVKGDLRASHFYVGYRIRSERTQSRFYIKTTRGLVPTHRLQVKNFVVNYGNSGYFRAEVMSITATAEEAIKYPMTGRVFGSPTNTLGSVAISDGSFKVPVNNENTQYTLTLVNDSFLPSQWTSCVYEFTVAYQAKPTEFGQSVPSYFNQGGSAGYANNF